MAYRTKNLTMTGAAQSIHPLSATVPHTPIKWIRFENATGNGTVVVGDKNITATIYGFTVAAGPANDKDIGPFGGGECPFNLEDVWVIGTDGQILRIAYMTL